MPLIDLGRRCLERFVAAEGAQLATILGSQAFTSLIPFLVVASAFEPSEQGLGQRIVERFDIEGALADSVRSLFNSASAVDSTITWVGVVILVLASLSFTRALQRTYQRAYGQPGRRAVDAWRGLAWLGGCGLWISVSAPLREGIEENAGVVVAIAAGSAIGFVLWLATPMLLLGRAHWRRLVPGAVVSGVLGAIFAVASSVYIPILMGWSARKYGLIGVAFSLQSWLLVYAFVIVIGAVVGAVLSEAGFLDRFGSRWSRGARSG